MVARCNTRVRYITICVPLMTTFALDYKGGLNYDMNTTYTFFQTIKDSVLKCGLRRVICLSM